MQVEPKRLELQACVGAGKPRKILNLRGANQAAKEDWATWVEEDWVAVTELKLSYHNGGI